MLIPLGFLAGSGGVAGTYELIETYVLGSSQSSVVFSSLGTYSSTYKHLQIRLAARTDRSDTSDFLRMRINGDTAANYANHELIGTGSSVVSGAGTSTSSMLFGRAGAASSGANVFGAVVVDILDAYSSTKNKTIRSLGGIATAQVRLDSGHRRSTESTTSLTILPGEGTNLVAGSRFSLYGIRG